MSSIPVAIAHVRRVNHPAARRSRGPRVVAALLALLAVAASAPLGAQGYFGKNHVQYDAFKWRVLETEHFLIYYYPEERQATLDAARMAERAYARLSRILDHQFREKKPIVLFASRSDFGQNNVLGDLGETTGGATEALRHRMLLNFTGDYVSFDRVLTHEMVHTFQFDVFAQGRAGRGMQVLSRTDMPQWFSDGMAEYLSLGPASTLTDMWMRDAALNGRLPSIREMSQRPDKYFPYRYGHALWTYVGQRWGDDVIGQLMHAIPGVGVERAFKRELGVSLEELGDEWREAMQTQYLPGIGEMERVRQFAQPLLTPRRTGGEFFLSPALSPDGTHLAFLSTGNLKRGEVFIDLWLGSTETGKRLKRLVKSTTDPDFEELRILYSQSAFSPDARYLAFTAQRRGRDVLYLLDVTTEEIVRRFDLPVEGASGPSFSPDGKQIVFSGTTGGLSDLYIVDVTGENLQRLTNDRFGDLQPQWSPQGSHIAFATDRGPDADLDRLRLPRWRIALLEVSTGRISVIPAQEGLNLNPQWAPDGGSIAYVSDRNGIPNLHLYELESREHHQLTNVAGGIAGVTEYSPAISWARGADRMAITHYDDGKYSIWTIQNPRQLRRWPLHVTPPATMVVAGSDEQAADSAAARVAAPGDTARVVAAVAPAAGATSDSSRVASAPYTPRRRSLYRTGMSFRASEELPYSGAPTSIRAPLTVAQLLDSAELALPDTATFRDREYRIRFQPDYVSQPTVGYAPDPYGRNVYGGAAVILSDLLGSNRLAIAGEVSGRISESRYFLGYSRIARRWQYSGGLSQAPYYFLSSDQVTRREDGTYIEQQEITTLVARQLFGMTAYPLNRFTRIELGAGFNNVDRQLTQITRELDEEVRVISFVVHPTRRDRTLNYADAQLALVSDNTLFGHSGALLGRRYRLQVMPVAGSFRWTEFMGDYRRYDPVIFNFLTVATRLYSSVSVGPDESQFPKYVARPDFVRGYDRNSSFYGTCPVVGANAASCSAVELLGSRVAVANAELRFPLIRQVVLGLIPVSLPPLDGLVFYDVGVAWSRGQTVYGVKPGGYSSARHRFPLQSYGFGIRLNLFNYATLRWDYAVPLNAPDRRGFWTWSLWPSF